MQMDQESKGQFRSVRQELLLNQLTNNYIANKSTFSIQDLKVDLVIRLRVPQNQPEHQGDQDQIQFIQIFKNAPQYFGKTYHTVEEYINFLIEKELKNNQKKPSRRMLSLAYLAQPRIMIRELVDIFGEDQIAITCQTQYLSQMDTFTLKYIMLIIVLQQLCGFHLKAYLFENQQDEGCEGQFAIYLLLSQSNQNMMKLADRYKIKKEVNMVHIDFSINDPVDKTNRPLKINKYFRKQQDQGQYINNQRALMRMLRVKDSHLSTHIAGEYQISKTEAEKFQRYNRQVFAELANILNTDPIEITNNQRKYIYHHNRCSLNPGTLSLLYQQKLRQKMYEKIINLNKQYGYPQHYYSETFVQFQVPSHNKSYFDKLRQLLKYKYTVSSPYGELTLFNKMERIKLAYASLEEYLRVQNFKKIGATVYAINDEFERFGRVTYQYDEKAESQTEFIVKGGLNGLTLVDVWNSIFPFSSKIRYIRDYLGESLAFQILIKIRMLAFLFCLIPLSVLAQYIIMTYFTRHTSTYQFGIFQLALMVISLTIFIEVWRKEQDIFFNNYVTVSVKQMKKYRFHYKGPYYRNIINDDPSEFLTQTGFTYRFFNLLAYIIICSILTLEGLFFMGIRYFIINMYQKWPILSWEYISLAHLIGYSIFFLTNFLLYLLLIQRIIIKMVDWHNLATKQEHQLKIRSFSYMFTLGIEIIGPLFLYVIEPFQGVSCYNAGCVDEFTIYAYSRFYIIFFIIILRLGKLLRRPVNGIYNIQPKNDKYQQNLDTYNSKLNFLIKFVKDQYKKEDFTYENEEKPLVLYYYCIFSISFPFCTVLAFFYLYVGYLLVRVYTLRYSRRPLPLGQNLYKLAGIYDLIKHACIIFNCWSLVLVYEMFEYDLSDILITFTQTLSTDNILSFKIVATSVGIIFYELISVITKATVNYFLNDQKQNRKVNMYRKYLIKCTSIVDKTIDHLVVKPLKTIFRTSTYASALQHKRSRQKLFLKTFSNKQGKTYNQNLTFTQSLHRLVEEEKESQMKLE